jgi:membrane-bound metal-dependent hydrolase YbcI (DUF457 family)
MPSIGLHLAITLFFLASILRDDDLKPALLLLPFGLISDFDSFIGVHRGTLHNLFIIFVPLFVLVAYKRLKGSTVKEKYFIFASLLLASHVFLDAFYNGVFLFYPFIEKSYNPLFWFGLTETGLRAFFTWIVPGKVGEFEYVITPQPAVPEIPIIASGIELVIVLFAVLTFVLKYKEHVIPRFLYEKAQIRK